MGDKRAKGEVTRVNERREQNEMNLDETARREEEEGKKEDREMEN